MSAKAKKSIVRFIAAGVAALVIHKLEDMINRKADDHFGPDEAPEN